MKELSKTFCVKAWKELAISPTGTYTPCCIYEKVLLDSNGIPFNAWTSNVSEVWNSENIKDVRRRMLAGEEIDACKQCYKVEAYGGVSNRQDANNKIRLSDEFGIEEKQLPNHIDLKLTNKCNLACRMCQPKDSNRITNEFTKIIKENSEFEIFENSALEDPFMNLALVDIPAWEDSDHFLKEFTKTIPNLDSMCFAGGEPLILKSFFKMTDLLSEKGRSKKMRITLTSNLTNFPEEKIKGLLNNFGQVLFNISIDAVGTEAMYVRYPTKWSTLKENILKLIELTRDTNSIIYFAPTVQVYNIINLHKVFEFIEDTVLTRMKHKDRFRDLCYLVNLTYPNHLNLNTLPPKAREISIVNLEDFVNNSKVLIQRESFLSNIKQIINILKNEYVDDIEMVQKNFLYYTEKLDESRMQRFQDFLPELYEAYKETGLKAEAPKPNFHYAARKLMSIRNKGWDFAKDNKLMEAIECFEKSLKTGLDPFIDLLELGWMKNATGKCEEAVSYYKKAIELKPNDFMANRELGASYLYVNDKKSAKKYLKLALEINPGDEQAQNLFSRTK